MSGFPALLRKCNFSSRSLEDGTAALGRVTRVCPALKPAFAAASFIAHHDTDPTLKRKAFLDLIKSEAVSLPLGRLDTGAQVQVRRLLGTREGGGLMKESEAMGLLKEAVFETEGAILRPLLRSVIQAGGLPLLIFALEAERDETLVGEETEIRKRLKDLELDFRKFLEDVRHFSGDQKRDFLIAHRAAASVRATEYLRGHASNEGIFDALFFAGVLGVFLSDHLPAAVFPEERQPARLTDLLMGVTGPIPKGGHCYPLHLVASHLALLAGKRYRPVFYPKHVNLFDPETGWVVNLNPNAFVSMLDDWRDSGLLGPDESAAPVEAFVAGALLNFGNFIKNQDPSRAHRFFQRALEIYPESSSFHEVLDIVDPQSEESEVHLRKALEINPRSTSAYAAMGMRCLRTSRFQEAIQHLREALRILEVNVESGRRVLGLRGLGGLSENEILPVRWALISSLIQLGEDLAEAERYLVDLLEKGPRTEVPLRLLVALLGRYASRGQTEKGTALLRRLVPVFEKDPDAARTLDGFLQGG